MPAFLLQKKENEGYVTKNAICITILCAASCKRSRIGAPFVSLIHTILRERRLHGKQIFLAPSAKQGSSASAPKKGTK